MYNWLVDGDTYDVDASRIFATGQSMGGSNTFNMISYRPQYFAGAAACSWVSTPGATADTSVDIPVMCLMGQNDTTVKGGLSGTSGMANAKSLFDYILNRYDLTEKGSLDRTWADFTFMNVNPICTEKTGMLNKYIFETEAGYPMFIGVEVVGMAHATIPTEVSYIWDISFSHYSRDPVTKVLYYDGNVVDTPVNKALALAESNVPELSYSTQTKIIDGVAYVSLFVENAPNLNTIAFDLGLADGITYANANIIEGGAIATSGNSACIFWANKTIDATNKTLVAVLSFNVGASGTAGLSEIQIAQYMPIRDASVVKAMDPISINYLVAASAALYDVDGDNIVNAADMSQLVVRYMAATGDGNYQSSFDFNLDGVIDILDITDLLIHFN